jgi:hypothetical protein
VKRLQLLIPTPTFPDRPSPSRIKVSSYIGFFYFKNLLGFPDENVNHTWSKDGLPALTHETGV